MLGTLEGTLLNLCTANPLSGADVVVVNENLFGSSDGSGAYSISNIPAGIHTILLFKEGFVVGALAVEISDSSTTNLNVDMTPIGGCPELFPPPIPPLGSLPSSGKELLKILASGGVTPYLFDIVLEQDPSKITQLSENIVEWFTAGRVNGNNVLRVMDALNEAAFFLISKNIPVPPTPPPPTPPPVPPPIPGITPPFNLIATTVSDTEIRLDWEISPEVPPMTIRFEFKEGAGGVYVGAGGGVSSTTTVVIPSLNPDTLYFFRVFLRDNGNVSPFSNEAFDTTDPAPTPPATVWFVDAGVVGSGNGTSWATAFKTVQEGVDVSSSGEQVWVKEGTYATGDVNPVVTMKDGVEIYGGFVGTESVLGDRGNPASFPTILDGETILNNRVIIGAANARLDGFKVVNGNRPLVGGGAGMVVSSITGLIVAKCIFDNNESNNHGGALWISDSTVIIEDCTFSNNLANLTGVLGDGGAIYIKQTSDVTITNCLFDLNVAEDRGGAIYSDFSTLIVSGCTFTDNQALDSSGGDGFGGALYNTTGRTITIEHCTFDNNSASVQGGAIRNFSSSPTIFNCLFINNSATYGGAINNFSGSSSLMTSCTFNSNSASFGGGVYNNNSNPTFINCILWGNTASIGGNQIFNSGAISPVSFSDFPTGEGPPGVGNIHLDPLFVTGPNGDYYLSQIASGQGSDSPCVDVGSTTAVLAGLDDRTTRTDEVLDSGTVDMGYHFDV